MPFSLVEIPQGYRLKTICCSTINEVGADTDTHYNFGGVA